MDAITTECEGSSIEEPSLLPPRMALVQDPAKDEKVGFIVMPCYDCEGLSSFGEPFRVYFDYEEALKVVETHSFDDPGDWFEIVEVYLPGPDLP